MDFKSVKELLASNKNIVITTHRSPDGDAIGSSLALHHLLVAHGHDVTVLVPDQFPPFLSWMKGSESIVIYELSKIRSREAIDKSDIIFSLDYNNLSRIAELGDLVEQKQVTKILIDHHLDPSHDFDFSMSDTSASSTAQMIYSFAVEVGLDHYIDQKVAECIYAGIMTDTGSFKFSSTSADTHRVVASLMDKGLVPERVHSSIFDTNSFSRLKLLGFTLSERFEFDQEKKISILRLSEEDKNEYNYQKGDTEGFVNYGLSVNGSKMAVFLSEDEGCTKFSFRSKGELDVNKIARAHFNGGGHKNAAGGKLDVPIDDAYKQLQNVINDLF
jgi:phosphoesterase RecJ-like protein